MVTSSDANVPLDGGSRPRAILGRPIRVVFFRFVVEFLLIGLVLWFMPGIRTSQELTVVTVALMAVVFALLNASVRPTLDLFLTQFVVQTYGLALIVVDIVVFALLLLIFSGSITAATVTSVLFGGVILGLLRLVAEGTLGLTTPIVPEWIGRSRPSPPAGLFKVSVSAREHLRLLRIQRTMVIHGVDAFFGREGLVGATRRRLQTWLWQPPVPLGVISPPERFRLLLEDLGPTFVKVGQIISSQAQGLPSQWLDELEQLQSDVQPYPYVFARQRIIDELGAPPEELYAEFDTVALAAASLGQVHRATLHDGTQVAVKVQRPSIHTQLRSDVRILARMSVALEKRMRWAEDINLGGVVLEFGTTLMRELDYDVEAYNARRLSRVLEPIEGVRVPEVHYDLSSKGVLTLEFISGVKSTDTDAIKAAGLDPELLATNIVNGSVKMLMIDGFFHADPHPGNVFVDLTTGEMVLLDTGMVGELTFQHRVKLGSLLLTIRNRDIHGLAQTLKSLSIPYRETDDEQYYADFERKLTPYLDPPPGQQIDVASKVMPSSLDALRDAGYRFDAQLTLAMKSMSQAEAITRALVPDWTGTEFTERAVGALQDQAIDALTPDMIADVALKQAGYFIREAVDQLPSMQQGTFKWLTHLKRGAIRVEVDTTDLGRQLDLIHRTARMITLGILIVGLVIGSAIAAGSGALEGSPLESVTDIAAAIFVGSAVIGSVWVLIEGWRLLRRSRSHDRGPLDRI